MGFKKGNNWGKINKGHRDYLSAEIRKKNGKKISLAKKGKPMSDANRTALQPYWDSKKHKKLSIEESERLRKSHTGEKHYMWKGGITTENMKIRHSNLYAIWRKHVFNRDDFTCQACGVRGGTLNADHVLPFAKYPDLRFEVLNGRTLCVPCHKKVTFNRIKN